MARAIVCDFDEGDAAPAVFMLSRLETGEQQAFCVDHVALLAQGLLASVGIPLVSGGDDGDGAGAGEGKGAAAAAPRPRRGRRVAVRDDGAGPAMAPQEGASETAG